MKKQNLSAIAAATQRIQAAANAPKAPAEPKYPTPEQAVELVRATFQMVAQSLDRHILHVDEQRDDQGKVVAVTLLGQSPAVQVIYTPELNLFNVVLYVYPLTDAIQVAELAVFLTDALASIPGLPVQVVPGGAIGISAENLGDGRMAIRFTKEHAEILDLLVETADQLPEVFRNMRDSFKEHQAQREAQAAAEPAEAANDPAGDLPEGWDNGVAHNDPAPAAEAEADKPA